MTTDGVVVTGAAGFVGGAILARLLEDGVAYDGRGHRFAVRRIIAADRARPARSAADARVEWHLGDISDPAFVRSIVAPGVRTVFHLAGVVSGAAEADFDLGMRVNLDGTRAVLEACRALPAPARLVFSSSIAVYGTPLPERIDDATYPVPTLSYGAQKLACEQLVNDYSRRGFVDGRSLRLPGIVARPAERNGALSIFLSDLIREPLAGRPVTSPVSERATTWIQSIERCVENFMYALALPADRLGQQRALLLPAISATIGEIVDALGVVRGVDVRPLVRFAPDPAIEPNFGRWPRAFTATRALDLGFQSDANLDALIRASRAT